MVKLVIVIAALTAAPQSEVPENVAKDLQLLKETIRSDKHYRETARIIDRLEINGGLTEAAELLVGELTEANRRGEELGENLSNIYYSFVTIRSHGAGVVPDLIPLLKSPHPWSRSTAAGILGMIGPKAKAAVPHLKPVLRDTELNVALEAAESLWKIDRLIEPGLPVFIAGLKSENLDHQISAVRALESIGPPAAPAAPVLVELLTRANDNLLDRTVSATAGTSLHNIGPACIPAVIDGLKQENPPAELVSLLGEFGGDHPDSAEALSGLLRSDNKLVAVASATALTRLGNTEGCLPVLIAGFRDRETREAALEGLALLGPEAKAVVPELKKAIEQSDEDFPLTRVRSCHALWCIAKDKLALEVLAETAVAPTFDGYEAGQILERIGPESLPILPRLVEEIEKINRLMSAGSDQAGVRNRCRSILDVLAAMGTEAADALPAVRQALRTAPARVKPRAALTAWKLGEPAEKLLPSLTESLEDADPEVAGTALQTLARMGREAKPAAPKVAELLSAKHDRLRYEAAYTHARIGGDATRSIPVLTEALDSGREFVIDEALDAVGALGGHAEPLHPKLLELATSGNLYHRASAMLALGRTGTKSPDAWQVLTEGLGAEEPFVRLFAAGACLSLGIDTGRAERILRESLDSRSARLRGMSVALLKSSGDVTPAWARERFEELARTDPDPEVRAEARAALNR